MKKTKEMEVKTNQTVPKGAKKECVYILDADDFEVVQKKLSQEEKLNILYAMQREEE